MFMKTGALLDKENRQKMLNLIYSVGATAIFNMVIQFLLYPAFERQLGAELYGVVLSIISLLAITAGTCGYSVSCSRLLGVTAARGEGNDNYNLILLAMNFVGSLIGIGYLFYLDLASPLSIGLFVLLNFLTMLRYYSEIEFRLKTNFFRYMIYYLLISVGYVIGLFVFQLTKEWMLALILGELFGFIYVIIRGSIYRPPFFRKTKEFAPIVASITFILISVLIDNITMHADRILLLAITGDGEAVTIYYISSLIGKLIALLTGPINALLISYLVRYEGGLTKKLWSVVIVIALGFCGLAFLGGMIVSPWIIGILYPHQVDAARAYFMPAILGQIFFFGSCVLMAILLRFKGERRQFVFNSCYAVEFFLCVALGTVFGGLNGFVWCILLANAIRFFAAMIWGFVGKKNT